jgi:6,7-dimethyl-8-ribityllumazine synthase
MAGRASSPRRRTRSRPGLGFAVVAARFNEAITKRLLDGAVRALAAAGVTGRDVEVHWVPGAFELPQAALHLARTRRFAAIICVGCVIRGQTPHFEFVAGQAAAGIQRVGLDTGVPTTFGVVTALTEAQAWERAGGEVANRGEEAAQAALEMVEFVQQHAPTARPRAIDARPPRPRSPAKGARR